MRRDDGTGRGEIDLTKTLETTTLSVADPVSPIIPEPKKKDLSENTDQLSYSS